MPTPQPPRSSYRERRINVMLQDHGSTASPTPEVPPLVKQEPRINRTVLAISIAVALLCAAIVFFLLFRHDATQSAPVARAVRPVTPQVSAPTPAPETAAAEPKEESVAAEPAPAPAVKAPEPQRIRVQLRRSGGFQSFGPLKLRLISTNPRRGMCQIAIATGGDHARTRSLSMNRSVQVQGEDGTTVDLLVNGMTKDSVRGSVVRHEEQSTQ